MIPATETVRLRDRDALRSSLRQLRRLVDVPVAFGGLLVDGDPVVVELDGTRTRGLRGLTVGVGRGLGGRAFLERRPRAVDDYGASTDISHEYDGAVLGEGITSLLAIPVVVFGRPRGLVYLGRRDRSGLADEVLNRVRPALSALEGEIRIRDEVEQRLDAADTALRSATQLELVALREAQAELRLIAAEVADHLLAARIREVGSRLVPVPPAAPEAKRGPSILAPRELDVLSLVALGCGNAEIAERLCIGSETVRSYLRNAMRKLGAHSRLEAVVAARRLGEMV